MKQKLYIFGKQKNLVGILQSPDKESNNLTTPIILILNSGLVNKSGPFRMNAELSRYLQKLNLKVFRFDLSGIGDSQLVANDGRVYSDRNLDDIGEALELLEGLFPKRPVIVLGLCTGADLAHKSAVRYEMIKGVILLDGYGYPTVRFYWIKYSHMFLSFPKLIRLPLKIIKRVTGILSNRLSGFRRSVDSYFWVLPSKSKYIEDLSRLSKRGCKQLYIFSSGVRDYYNYHDQLRDSVSRQDILGDISVVINHAADHTYIMLEERNRLFNTISTWISNEFLK